MTFSGFAWYTALEEVHNGSHISTIRPTDGVMTNTREQILKVILTQQRCSINDLAEMVGINPISVRHHIIKLEAEGYVDSEEERHGVGRPRRMYFLTEAGLERFPTRYFRLTNRILEQLKDVVPDHIIGDLFTQMGEEMAEKFARELELEDLTMEERLNLLITLLQREGFHVEWERKGNEYHIKEMNCPYYHVGQSHPEVCSVDKTLISKVLSVPATRVRCLLEGDSFCTYVVPSIPMSEIAVLETQSQQ